MQFSKPAYMPNLAWCDLLAQKNILLLQGPVGPFFSKLSDVLKNRGARVSRVFFNGGDAFDGRNDPSVDGHHFRGQLAQWPDFLESIFWAQQITAVVMFGQGRAYHREAIRKANDMCVMVFVMDEGYFRPGYVTLESNGLNAYSTGMSDASEVLKQNLHLMVPAPEKVRYEYLKMAKSALFHYVALAHQKSRYPHYQHHRTVSLSHHAAYWLRSWFRKLKNKIPDKNLLSGLLNKGAAYFFVPLQSPEDSQISLHSPYTHIEEFINEVMSSFSKNADKHSELLFKQHPMSRGGAAVRSIHSITGQVTGYL